MRRLSRLATAAFVLVLTAGCGLGASSEITDIDPRALPPRLVATASPSPAAPADPAAPATGVYFLGENNLRLSPRALTIRSGMPALQELLTALAAGPDTTDRQRGLNTALPPTTRLTVMSLEATLATVDLSFGQVPPDQTTAIAQIVLTATSLAGVKQLLLTIEGRPLQAPLANGAQTDRPLRRADYVALLSR